MALVYGVIGLNVAQHRYENNQLLGQIAAEEKVALRQIELFLTILLYFCGAKVVFCQLPVVILAKNVQLSQLIDPGEMYLAPLQF